MMGARGNLPPKRPQMTDSFHSSQKNGSRVASKAAPGC